LSEGQVRGITVKTKLVEEKWGTCNGLWHRNEVPGRKPLSESKLMIPTQIYGQPDKRKWKKVKEIERVVQKKI